MFQILGRSFWKLYEVKRVEEEKDVLLNGTGPCLAVV